MSPFATAAAKPTEWEVDDAAPTRLRWEAVKNVPSDLEATTVLRAEPALKTLRDFPAFEDELKSDAATRVRVLPGALARMPKHDADVNEPIPLARRRDSAPTNSDIREIRPEWDSFPALPDESGAFLATRVAPPPHAWVEAPAAPVRVAPHVTLLPPALEPTVLVVRKNQSPSNLKLLLIACWAFALTMTLIVGVAARAMSSMM